MNKREAEIKLEEIIKLREQKQYIEADKIREELVKDNWLVSYEKNGTIFLMKRI